MPRARLSNASFIASGESPVLPFLAPRVFAESPIARRRSPQHGTSTRTQKEEAKSKSNDLWLNTDGNESTRTSLAAAYTLRGEETAAGGLLRKCHSRWKHTGETIHPDSVERRYADIFAFARCSVRGYRTLQSRRSSQYAMNNSEVHQQTTEAPVEREPLPRKQRMLKLASRREAALEVERERLATLLAHESDHDLTSLMKNGQYRSLCRRIGNLQRWSETQLDLNERRGNAKVSFAPVRAFAALDRTLYAGIGQHTRKIIIKHDFRCPRLSVRLFGGMSRQSVRQIWENWMALDKTFRQAIYQRLLVYLLDRKPVRALQFIKVLSHDYVLRGPKMETIADGLGHLSKLHKRGTYNIRHGWNDDKSIIKQEFVAAFVAVFEQSLAMQRKVCSQDLLYNVAIIATGKDLKRVWASLSEHRAYMGYDTILHYANSFAKAGDNASALQCLGLLKKNQSSESWEATSDRQRLRWTCALILRESMSKSQDYHETPNIVATIVGLGIKMDILLYNVVMHNAMEASDYSTAFKVYNTLEDNGLEADKHTYSILLHGCTTQNNPIMFSQFAQHCAKVALEIGDPWLATDYLHYLYACRQRDSNKAETAALLQREYVRFFPSPTSEHLTARESHISLANSSEDTTILTPPPAALYILLQAQIQDALATSTRQVSNLYDKFRSLVQDGRSATFNKLARDPIIWNAFLLAFCDKQQFASASQLLKDMTEGSPKPNIYSWNIFMQAFFKTGQVQAAERVFEIMRSRDVDPDQFTYGVLLRGYAKSQQIERIGEIMQHTDAEQEMEPDLLRALAQITNRNLLMLTLEKVRVRKETQAREEADTQAQEEKRRWSAPRLATAAPEDAEALALDPLSGEDRDTQEDQLTDADIAELGEQLDRTLDERLALKRSRQIPASAAPSSSEHSSDVSLAADSLDRSAEEGKHAVDRHVDGTHESATGSRATVREEPQTRVPRPSKSGSADSSKPTPPPARERPENLLDPEVQYRKLQEQLGLVAGVVPSSSATSSTPPQPNISFGLSLGYKTAHAEEEEDALILDPLPEKVRRVSGKTTRPISPRTTVTRVRPRASMSRTVYPKQFKIPRPFSKK